MKTNSVRPLVRAAFTLLTATLTLNLAAVRTASASSLPNILFILCDDLGYGDVSCYNPKSKIQTPNLDRLATQGMRFIDAHTPSGVCSPTRYGVLTGRYAWRSTLKSGVLQGYSTPLIAPGRETVAAMLKIEGYRTACIDKWHIGAVKKESPLNPNRMGFDEYLSHDNFFEMNPPLSRNGAPPEIIVDEAVMFARKVCAEDKPFFIVIWFGSPHGPYSGLDKDIALYRDVPKEEMRLRFAEITAMDRAIGTFRRALRELRVEENTLLWFNSDNGIPVAQEADSFNGGWRGRKGDVYEGGLRVPAVIEWPAVIKQPRLSAAPCVTSDILPTVLDLLGLKHPAPQRPLDGISLRSLIVDGSMKERPSPIGFWKYPAAGESKNGRWVSEELSRGTTPTTRNPAIDFTNYKHPVAKTDNFGGEAAWTDNRYKLVVNAGKRGSGRAELYDLLADPKESKDLAGQHPDVVKRMTEQLHAWQRSVDLSLTGADYLKP